MDSGIPELRWGGEQRHELLEFHLFWEGHVNRSDLMEQFGLSLNQASADMNRYLGLAPENMVYDKSTRSYVRGSTFKPVFKKLDAGRYLAQLRSLSEGILGRDDSWVADPPAFDAAPTPACDVNPEILRTVIGAIPGRKTIEVKYRPLSSPEPGLRGGRITRHRDRRVPLAHASLLPQRPKLQEFPALADHRYPRHQAERSGAFGGRRPE